MELVSGQRGLAKSNNFQLLIDFHYKSVFSYEYVGPRVVRGRIYANPFYAHYSVPASPVYYLSAGMIAWSVRISGLIRKRWFLVASES